MTCREHGDTTFMSPCPYCEQERAEKAEFERDALRARLKEVCAHAFNIGNGKMVCKFERDFILACRDLVEKK